MAKIFRFNNPNITAVGGDSTKETGLIQVAQFSSNPDGVYGSGVDGNVTISSNSSLSRDMYYNNLTINSSIQLAPNGYRIFVKNQLILKINML